MIIIRTFQDSSADFSQTIDLDGTPFKLRMTWNTRLASWYMDILTKDLQPILLGIGLVSSYLLLDEWSMDGLPKGDFYLWDSESKPENFGVTFDNLGARYVLMYLTEDELDEL